MKTDAESRRWWLHTIMVTALASIIMGVVAIEYANHAIAQSQKQSRYTIAENQRQWCEVVTTLDDTYRQNPPTTPTGRHLAEEFARLRISFGCDGR